jgi:hypothetical protein
MRFVKAAALAFAAVAAVVAPPHQAEAFGWGDDHSPSGWGEQRTIHHHVYYPRYKHVYHVHPATDPYAYRYAPRGYYPSYTSHYWVPAEHVRARQAQTYSGYSGPKYEYQPAWGSNGQDHQRSGKHPVK